MLNEKKETHNTLYEYEFHDFYTKKGINWIVAKIVGTSRGIFKMPAVQMIQTRKDLLKKFSDDDKINIIGLATTEKPPVIIYNQTRQFKYFSLLAMLFACFLITSNIASSKLIQIFGITLTAGTLPYTFTYSLGNIITEVYGYKRARQLIWGSVTCNLMVVLFLYIAIISPSSSLWNHQKEYASVLGAIPRIIVASMISYFSSEFLNSYVIAKLKISYKGEKLWKRIIISSLVAITIDNFIFLIIAYYGVMPLENIYELSYKSYGISLILEWTLIPLTCYLSKNLKLIEHTDVFDVNTQFTPFSLDVSYDADCNK